MKHENAYYCAYSVQCLAESVATRGRLERVGSSGAAQSSRRATRREGVGVPGCSTPPQKIEIKKRFRTQDDIKHCTRFTLRPKSADCWYIGMLKNTRRESQCGNIRRKFIMLKEGLAATYITSPLLAN
jgi:hypothetical protein